MADPDLREAARAPFRYHADVLADLVPGALYVLRGPRRVGKTVAIKGTIRNLIASGVAPRHIVHMAVDGLRSRDLGLLIDAADGSMPPDAHRYWFIDEITGIADGWPERVKWLRDNDARFRRDTVVLTGSSAGDLTQATKALAGRRGEARAPDRVLLPIGFRSFMRLADDAEPLPQMGGRDVADLDYEELRRILPELVPWQDALIKGWEGYVVCGGFPAAVAQHVADREPPAALRASLVDVIHGDAFRRADWSRTQSTDLLRRLSANLCSPLNIASLANDIGVPQTSVKRRIDELREAFIAWPCYREDNLRPKLGAQAKLYFTDPLYASLGTDPDGAWRGVDFGQLSEQQLGMALLRATERRAPGTLLGYDQVLHHRSASRKEVDFVGPRFGGVAIEAKYVDGGWRRAAQTLQASRWRGLVATRSELDLSTRDVAAVPIAMLAWLIDS